MGFQGNVFSRKGLFNSRWATSLEPKFLIIFYHSKITRLFRRNDMAEGNQKSLILTESMGAESADV